MNAHLIDKLQTLSERHEEVALLLAQPDIASDVSHFRKLSREYAHLDELITTWKTFRDTEQALEEAKSLRSDPELGELAKSDIERLTPVLEQMDEQLKTLLVPPDPLDDANLFLEIRAGTGGDEAALFAGDLMRMYTRFAENNHWQVQILSTNEGEHGGYKEVVARIEGERVYSHLKFESGTHRVQRVPETEAGGRIHTSAATVAILPEMDQVEDVDIQTNDLRIDTFRASGAGGQHVNKTDSAIRITHIPTGMVVECQDERSQHKNRARAMSLLKARLLDQAQSEQMAEQAQSRRLQVGSGDRSQRIRTYNFPQGRVTDHRINLTLYRLGEVMEGDLDSIIDPLMREQRADTLKAEMGT